MKKFIVADSGNIGLDTETEEVFALDTQREGISRIYVAQEPMTIVVTKAGKNYELEVKKDDIIIVFYEVLFENPVVVVKNKAWVKNLKSYEKAMQNREEEWAKAKNGCTKDC